MVNRSREHGRRLTWTLSVWVKHPDCDTQEWAGLLQSTSGQRWGFRSLVELDRLICELGGWIDPSASDYSLPPEHPLKADTCVPEISPDITNT